MEDPVLELERLANLLYMVAPDLEDKKEAWKARSLANKINFVIKNINSMENADRIINKVREDAEAFIKRHGRKLEWINQVKILNSYINALRDLRGRNLIPKKKFLELYTQITNLITRLELTHEALDPKEIERYSPDNILQRVGKQARLF